MTSIEAVTARADRHHLDDITRRHVRVRFRCSPDALPPELHQIIARWLRMIERTTGADQDRRTAEAVRAVMQMTDWTEVDARLAMRNVADHLSPKEPSPHGDTAADGPAATLASGRPRSGTMADATGGR